eukprot:TRINITY_DN7024_c0_g1_i3.p3 TRINITY_DN7024_c0_g1~~TRINITY_DN7024_c0_g1_i3.p3  ORF type:complete len:146 (+),score=28.80 TRINITY_DN7024_c0_g1_i3:398-835(+)
MQKEFDKLAIPQLQLVPNILCKGQEHLEEELKLVEAKKGEGLMLKNPDSYYQNKRSYDLLKVKTFHDEEAIVIGYKPGKGQNSGVVGALFVRNDAGVEFYVGSGLTDQERRRPPKKGTKITYKYQNLTNSGKPRFPTFQRVYQGP